MSRFFSSAACAGFALTLLIGIVFFATSTAGFVEYDDPAFVTKNGYVNQGVTGTGIRWAFTQEDLGRPLMHKGVANLWHPLTWMSHMLDVELFGLENPGGHHLQSVALHLLAALLLLACLSKLGTSPMVAFFVTALFAVHPMRVESVAWISERKDVLSGVFFFATVLAYLHKKKALSVFLYALALMAKPSVVVLPGILILLDWWNAGFLLPKSPLRWLVHEVKDKLPWIIPGLAVVALTLWFQYTGSHRDFVTPLGARLFLMPSALVFYLVRTIWPIDLSFHYPYPPGPIWHFMAAGILVVLAVVLWRVRKRFPQLVFGALWFLILWVPVSGIFHVGTSFTADRYTYLAHVGLFLAFLSVIKRSVVFVGGFATMICSLLAFQQVKVWQNSESLFAHGAKVQPRDAVAIENLAGLRQQDGRHYEAMALYRQALKNAPNSYIGHYNLSLSLRAIGELAAAKESLEKSLTINPNYLPAHIAFTNFLREEGDLVAAARHGLIACELSNYQSAKAVVALVKVEADRGNPDSALKIIAKAPPRIQAMIQVNRR